MLLDRFSLKYSGAEYRVAVTMMERCPHKVYSVYYNNEKLFGVLDRPNGAYCHMRHQELKARRRTLKSWSDGRRGK
jgi:hypothetical protein